MVRQPGHRPGHASPAYFISPHVTGRMWGMDGFLLRKVRVIHAAQALLLCWLLHLTLAEPLLLHEGVTREIPASRVSASPPWGLTRQATIRPEWTSSPQPSANTYVVCSASGVTVTVKPCFGSHWAMAAFLGVLACAVDYWCNLCVLEGQWATGAALHCHLGLRGHIAVAFQDPAFPITTGIWWFHCCCSFLEGSGEIKGVL